MSAGWWFFIIFNVAVIIMIILVHRSRERALREQHARWEQEQECYFEEIQAKRDAIKMAEARQEELENINRDYEDAMRAEQIMEELEGGKNDLR